MARLQIVEDETPEVGTMSDDALLAELAASLELTAMHLVRLAAVWGELERRGHDLSRLRSGLREWLPMIATRKLAAECVVQYAGQNALLRALAELPLHRQRDFANGEEVVVLTFARGGGFASEKLPVHRLTGPDIALVFHRGHIRTSEEQIPLLQDRARRRQSRRPATVELRLQATEHQQLVDAAKEQHMHVSTLIMNTLRAAGIIATR